MNTRVSSQFEVRGWHVLAAMLVFFGAIIAINVAFAVVAVRSFPGEDVQRSYLQGLNYNQTLSDRRAQAQLGWRALAGVVASSGEQDLIVVVRDGADAPLNALTVEGVLRWPSDSHRDRALQFTGVGGGVYRAPLGVLSPGQWRLRAKARDANGHTFDLESDLTWPQ